MMSRRIGPRSPYVQKMPVQMIPPDRVLAIAPAYVKRAPANMVERRPGILLGFGMIGVQATSLLMGALAVTLTWLAGSGKNKGLSTIVLSGIMMGSLFNALVSLVKFVADEESQLPAITYWLMGGLNSAGYETLKLGALPILIGIFILYLIRWRMNLLPLSEDEVKSSGVNIKVLRGITIVCATGITASCVSMCGQEGWVALLIPHMCRMKFGSNH